MQMNQLPAAIKREIKNAKLPVIFEDAVKALVACRTLDEAQYFADKAEALKAWAKIHKSKQTEREARALTLHAHRRMGQLAEELRPSNVYKGTRVDGKFAGGGRPLGAHSLLRAHGMTVSSANSATALRRMPDEKFEALTSQPRPPGITEAARSQSVRGSENWRVMKLDKGSPLSSKYFCRRHDPKELARGLSDSEAKIARAAVAEVIDWLDTFEQHLPKAKP